MSVTYFEIANNRQRIKGLTTLKFYVDFDEDKNIKESENFANSDRYNFLGRMQRNIFLVPLSRFHSEYYKFVKK